jgi:hypothetical protein
MTKNSVADALRELAQSNENRSETARLRDVFPEVEAALAAGVSRSAVLDALRAQGFTMTLKSFESALYRIRRRQKGKAGTPGQPPAGPRNPGDQVRPESAPASETAPHDGPADDPEETGHLTMKQQNERFADRFMARSSTNPLLKKLTTKETK